MIVGGQICRTQNVNEISHRGFNNKSNNIERWFIYELGFITDITSPISIRTGLNDALYIYIYICTYVTYI